MFEYSKKILYKVSFDTHLFEKELSKSLVYLKKDERYALLDWSNRRFKGEIKKIIKRYILGERLNRNYECQYVNVG